MQDRYIKVTSIHSSPNILFGSGLLDQRKVKKGCETEADLIDEIEIVTQEGGFEVNVDYHGKTLFSVYQISGEISGVTVNLEENDYSPEGILWCVIDDLLEEFGWDNVRWLSYNWGDLRN